MDVMEDENKSGGTFYSLVSGLQNEERLEMLRKMQSQASSGSAILETQEIPEEESPEFTYTARLKRESIFLRIWLFLKSIFTSTPVESLYNDSLVAKISHKIESSSPGLLDYSKQCLSYVFCDKLTELKSAARFFSEYLATYEKNPGSFYVLLGSIIMPQIGEIMDKEADPYVYSLNKEITTEMRTSLLRKMDDVLQKINPEQKAQMYACVRSIEWLRLLNRLPFEDILSKFSSVVNDVKSCPFSLVESEIQVFAKTLCNGHTIPNEVLEALYLFNRREITSGGDYDSSDANDGGSSFVEKASSELSIISMFISSVPMRSVARVVTNNAVFLPGDFTGGEDWYVKYKAEWKRLFDCKWELWLRDCKKEKIRYKISTYFLMGNFPLFPRRPWNELWGGIQFSYELTLGFIYSFMKDIYAQYTGALKTITLEGDFALKDNRFEFTEVVNKFTQINRQLDELLIKLGANGEYGAEFEKYISLKSKTKTGVQKISGIMEDIEDLCQTTVNVFGESCRMMEHLLRGFLGVEQDAHFATLTNFSSLRGRENNQFREEVETIVLGVNHALEIVKDLEPVDKPIVR